MIGFNFQFVDETQRVVKASQDASFRNLGHAAAAIRKDAIESIIDAPGPSEPGTPPHTHTAGVTRKGKARKGEAQRAIAYDANQDSAVIGPRASVVGLSMHAHEFGDEFHGEDYPERPTMGPALDRNENRFASEWAGSIGE